MNFVKHRYIYMAISAILIIAGICFAAVKGFNFGIDFSGGTVITIQAPKFIEEQKN